MNLEDKKAELLKALRSGENLTDSATRVSRIDRVPGADYPLTYAQEQLWTIDRLFPGTCVYSIPTALRLEGDLRLDFLQRAFDDLVRKHEALRCNFRESDRGPACVVNETSTLEITVSDAPELSDVTISRELQRYIQQPFDLETDSLIRAHLLRLPDDSSILLIVTHHIISDGWSVHVLLRDLAHFYNRAANNDESNFHDSDHSLSCQMVDFADWQRQNLETPAAAKSLAYWKCELSGDLPVSRLPTDRPRPSRLTVDGNYLERDMPTGLTESVKALARRLDVTQFVLLYATFLVLLQKYSAAKDFVIGTPVSSRRQRELENVVGFFVETLALRSTLEPDTAFSEFVRSTKDSVLTAFDNADIPISLLLEDLDIDRDLSLNPIFQVMFAVQNVPPPSFELDGIVATEVAHDQIHTKTSKVDLSFIVNEHESGLGIAIEYNTGLYDRESVKQLLDHYVILLQNIVDSPDSAVASLTCLGDSERRFLLDELNDTVSPLADDLFVPELVVDQCRETPDAIAIVSDLEQITYAELERRSAAIAGLLYERGTKSGDVVAVQMPRSPNLVAALLAILRIGAAYLPIDPATPRLRLQFMLEDSGATALISSKTILGSDFTDASIVQFIECDDRFDHDVGDVEIKAALSPSSGAYLIYTSGSTGTPKGVPIHHRGLLNLVRWHQRAYGVSAGDRATSLAGLGFDASVWELWPYLSAGASIYLGNDEVRLSPSTLADWYAQHRITISFLPTPLAEAFLRDFTSDETELKFLLTGGDKLRQYPSRTLPFKLVNHYGPTENTVVTTCCDVPGGKRDEAAPPIGQPIDNTKIYILDEMLQPVPRGARGQLYISGVGLTSGYLNNPGLTAARFLDNPYGKGEFDTIYATGDVVRLNRDNQVEFLERTDFQVKIRGYRIELGEIESVLISHPQVVQAAVVVVNGPDGQTPHSLAGFFKVEQNGAASTDDIRHFLMQSLPEYMVPGFLQEVADFILTPNGKIDRAALPVPEVAETDTVASGRPPTSADEIQICRTWAEVLDLDPDAVHLDDNFFRIGGHSLLATRVVSRLNQALGVNLPVTSIFQNPTVSALAALIRDSREDSAPHFEGIRAVAPDEAVPATHTQQRLWYLDQLDPMDPLYNVPICLELNGSIESERMQQALEQVVNCHDSLRTTFSVHSVEPVLDVDDELRVSLRVEDMTGAGDADVDRFIDRLMTEGFDLARGPLFRAALIRREQDKFLFVLVVHHIVFDGWSANIFLKDLLRVYSGLTDRADFELEQAMPQFRDYAKWQHNWVRSGGARAQLDVWRTRLSGQLPTLNVPTQSPRPTVRSTKGAQVSLAIAPDQMEKIRSSCDEAQVTPYIYFLTAYAALLFRYTQQTDVVIGTTIANRRTTETEGIVGCFVNTLPLRLQFTPEVTFHELLGQVRTVCLEAFDNQDIPFATLVEELQPPRDTSRTPIYQTMFSQVDVDPVLKTDGVRARTVALPSKVAKTDLSLSLESDENGTMLQLEYATSLFTEQFAKELLRNLETLIRDVTGSLDKSLTSVRVVNEPSRRRQIVEWNATQLEYDPDVPMYELFLAAAEARPDKIAAISRSREISYRELREQSDRLARMLHEQGARPGTMIAVCVDRSEMMLIAMLAIFRLGAAYLPLDPEYPRNRIRYIVGDAGVSHVLFEESVADLFDPRSVNMIDVGKLADVVSGPQSTEFDVKVDRTPNDLAYAIYTSGSTGKPKGVAVTQRNLTNFIHAMRAAPGMDEQDVVFAITTLSFDIAVLELLVPLACGSTIVIADRDSILNPVELAEMMNRHDVTFAQGTPSAWQGIVSAGWQGKKNLRLVVGGEALSPALSKMLVSRASQLFNYYGPTETTIWSTGYQIKNEDDDPLIGTPVANTQVYVLDPALQVTPIGVPGELYIGGDGVSNGYLGKPDLTKERFIDNPVTDGGGKLYRTGDQVRFRENGALEYIGRLDNQVKIRGFRIELGEIEAVVRSNDSVDQCIVLVREDRPGDIRLVCYFIPVAGANVAVADLRKYCRAHLPAFMVPQHYVAMNSFPLTPNAKIDRKALPAPTVQGELKERVIEPRTDMEIRLAKIWKDILDVDTVSVHDNFFDLGGHSLLSFQVAARVREELGQDVSVRTLIMENLEQIAAGLNRPGAPDETDSGEIDTAPKSSRSLLRSMMQAISRAIPGSRQQ